MRVARHDVTSSNTEQSLSKIPSSFYDTGLELQVNVYTKGIFGISIYVEDWNDSCILP
jgi:hypothetical protein